VRVRACMRREGGSFICSEDVSPSVCLVCIKEASRGGHVGGRDRESNANYNANAV
jgi:hypothetical protein